MNKIELREYQDNAVNETMYHIDMGEKMILLSAFTSWGKSLYIAGVIREYLKFNSVENNKIIVLVNISSLISQISEHLSAFNIKHGIIKAGIDNPELGSNVQIVMSQTMYSRIEDYDFRAEFIIQDEIHKEYNTKRTKTIIDKMQPKFRIGMTATPYDASGFALPGSPTIIQSKSAKELEEDGFIVPIRYYVAKEFQDIDYSSALRSDGKEFAVDKLDALSIEKNLGPKIVKAMNLIDAKNKKTIVFCNSIAQAKEINQLLKIDGYNSIEFHSQTDDNDDEVISKFRNNEIKCLVTVMKASIGFNVPDVELGVMVRATMTRSLWVQSVGRLCRKSEGKDYAELLDLGQNLERFGFANEDYIPVDKQDKHSKTKLQQITRKLSLPEINLLTKDDALSEIDYKMILQERNKIEKVKLDNLHLQSLNILDNIFNTTTNVKMLIAIAKEFETRLNGGKLHNYGSNMVSWAAIPIEEMLRTYPSLTDSILKSIRTRLRNIVKNKKKISSIHYFPDYLKDNPPYNYFIRQHNQSGIESTTEESDKINDYDIGDDEIPF